jgi:hypothetical protein
MDAPPSQDNLNPTLCAVGMPPKSGEETTKNNSRIHPVEGYSDTENMWEKLWNLEKPD